MIYELASASFERVAPLVGEMWSDRALVESVIEGSRPGRVWVDDAELPTAIFLCALGGDYYLLGDAGSKSLRQFLADRPSEAEVFDQVFAYFMPDSAWRDALLADAETPFAFYNVKGFRYAKESIPEMEHWRARARPDVTVRQIDESLLREVEAGTLRTNHEFSETFLRMVARERFGFCVVAEDEVASVAWAFAISERYSSLFIDTEERFRRQGLATLACAAFIEYSLAQGLMPLWACLYTNAASEATARTLGFEEVSGRVESAWEPYGRGFKGPTGLWVAETGSEGLPAGTVVWRRTMDGGR